jgi:hypothetical protein
MPQAADNMSILLTIKKAGGGSAVAVLLVCIATCAQAQSANYEESAPTRFQIRWYSTTASVSRPRMTGNIGGKRSSNFFRQMYSATVRGLPRGSNSKSSILTRMRLAEKQFAFSGNQSVISDPAIKLPTIWDRRTHVRQQAPEESRGRDGEFEVEKILARGYGFATICYQNMEPDFQMDKASLRRMTGEPSGLGPMG